MAGPSKADLEKELATLKGSHTKLQGAYDKLKADHENSQSKVEEQTDNVSLGGEEQEITLGDTSAKVKLPNAGHMTPQVLVPGHPLVPHYESGYAVEKPMVNAAEPAAHARPADLDPRTNGPFLDEIRELEAANAANTDIHDKFMEVVGDRLESEAKAKQDA
jgi:hypothetical protein